MIPVYQNRFREDGPGSRGNCMQAATASILNLKLEEVPNFIMMEKPYDEMVKFFLKKGFRLRECPRDFIPPNYYLASGISTQAHRHIVVAKGGKLAHDPNPVGRGLLTVDETHWPIPLTGEAYKIIRGDI